jgi:sarcosine oxidase subunit alpha
VLGTEGDLRVKRHRAGRGAMTARVSARPRRFDCDVVLMSGGFTPSVHLFSQSRGKLAWRDHLKAFVPGQSAENERSAGACRGVFDLAEALATGRAPARPPRLPDPPGRSTRFVVEANFAATMPIWARCPLPREFAKPSTILRRLAARRDHQGSALATREAFSPSSTSSAIPPRAWPPIRARPRISMPWPSSRRRSRSPFPQVGLTTFRMPYTPVTFGSFAGISRGDLFDPVRTTPTHAWAQARAPCSRTSACGSARAISARGEDMHAAVARECLAVRNACGIFDASTLGKIEVVGADAAEFMNRLYINSWTNLGVGRSRYGILLPRRRLHLRRRRGGAHRPDRFHVTTTTGGAPRVLAMMEDYRQTEWPDLKVWLTSTTEQWAVIAVQGPNARQVLEPLVEGIDLSAAALPHMSVAAAHLRRAPCCCSA